MRAADHLVDFGPGPGVQGGRGRRRGHARRRSPKPPAVAHRPVPRRQRSDRRPRASGRPPTAAADDRRGRGSTTSRTSTSRSRSACSSASPACSGSGKCSLVGDILRDTLARDLNGAITEPGAHDRIDGARPARQGHRHRPVADRPDAAVEPGHLYQALRPDPRPVHAGSPRPRPAATRRAGSASTSRAAAARRARGTARTGSRWTSSPTSGCTCPVCEGKRFNRETLHVRFKGKSISDVLEMDVQEALEHFANVPKIAGMLQTLHDVGPRLPQARPAVADALRRRGAADQAGAGAGPSGGTGKTLYILDEPTTGLHFDDVRKLLDVLHGFTAPGNTVVVIEHNLDVIKTADWVIDLGPEGGEEGGRSSPRGPPSRSPPWKAPTPAAFLPNWSSRQSRSPVHAAARSGSRPEAIRSWGSGGSVGRGDEAPMAPPRSPKEATRSAGGLSLTRRCRDISEESASM